MVTGIGMNANTQLWDVAKDSATAEVSSVTPGSQLPDEWHTWTPNEGQFRLYVNFDNTSGNQLPRIDILGHFGSWPFTMQYLNDTVYVYVVPPGYTLTKRVSITQLPEDFPLVVWAGTERGTYWFSADENDVTIKAVTPASFLVIETVHALPEDAILVQLPVSGPRSYKLIKDLIEGVGNNAEIVQLDEGFYKGMWLWIRKTQVMRYKVNENKLGTLVCLRGADPEKVKAIESLVLR